MKVLIVEDNANLADVVRMGLSMEGMEAKAVYDGRDALEELNSGEWNMLILDRDLPGLHGDEIAKRLGERRDPIHILMLTAASQTEDIVRGLDLGADDYLTKPFLMQELVLRIQHLLQRTYRAELRRSMSGSIQIGSRNILLSDALIQLPDGSTLSLTATERTILQKLIENRGHIVTYDALCEAVWGDGYYGYENSLNVHIRHLREKIGENVGKPQYLITMRGIGYKLTEAR